MLWEERVPLNALPCALKTAPGLLTRHAENLTDFIPGFLHQAVLQHGTEFRIIAFKHLISTDQQFEVILPV